MRGYLSTVGLRSGNIVVSKWVAKIRHDAILKIDLCLTIIFDCLTMLTNPQVTSLGEDFTILTNLYIACLCICIARKNVEIKHGSPFG